MIGVLETLLIFISRGVINTTRGPQELGESHVAQTYVF